MADFILPEEHEKLGFKFILDRRSKNVEVEVVEAIAVVEILPSEPEIICGTDASEAPESTQLEIPTEQLAPPADLPDSGDSAYEPLALPLDKKYFRIGEVSELMGVEPYVLRYWESEFATIKPVKSGSGHRVYARKDVETLHRIKHLLYVEKFSIKGAKKKLTEKKREVTTATAVNHQAIRDLVKELKELVQIARNQPL